MDKKILVVDDDHKTAHLIEVYLEKDGYTVSIARHEVSRGGRPAALAPTESKLLEVLARHPGRAFSRMQLVDRVLGMDYAGFERTIDVHVANLRRKIEPDPSRPRYVKTVLGVGYKLEASPDVS